MMRRILLGVLLLLAACSHDNDPPWLGYGEGDDVFVAAPAPGWIVQLAVSRGQRVQKGDLLFSLDDTSERAARDQALANLASMNAQMRQNRASVSYASKALSRQGRLKQAAAGSQDALDLARSAYDQNQARTLQIAALEQEAEAALRNADYQLAQRRVLAQVAGRVDDIYFRAGEYVPPSTAVVSLLPPQNVFVRFFVPEKQFGRVKAGDRVRISCDGCARDMSAVITFIAPQEEFTPPVIFSAGSRDKLVFKLEARAPGGLKLNPGGPVEVRPL